MNEPTNRELLLRLEHLATQLTTAVGAIDRISHTLEESYVRKDVYNNRHDALRVNLEALIHTVARDVSDLEADSKDDAKHRRQTWTAIGLAFATAVIGILVGLITNSGGGVV